MYLPTSFWATDFVIIALITGIVDVLNIPMLEERYMCQGFQTKALATQPIEFEKHDKKIIVVSGRSENFQKKKRFNFQVFK